MSGGKGYSLEALFQVLYKLPEEGIRMVSRDKPEEFAKQKHKIIKALLEDPRSTIDDDDLHLKRKIQALDLKDCPHLPKKSSIGGAAKTGLVVRLKLNYGLVRLLPPPAAAAED